jgi:DNA-binding transcriptional MerR regulator
MQIGQLSLSTGLSIDTIRFYEKQLLVPPPKRTASGYRRYDKDDAERFRLIGRAQRLGFSLQEIRELILIDTNETAGCSHVRDLVATKVEQVKEKIAELKRIEARLKKAQRLCTSALEISCDAKCPVLRELESSSEKVI